MLKIHFLALVNPGLFDVKQAMLLYVVPLGKSSLVNPPLPAEIFCLSD